MCLGIAFTNYFVRFVRNFPSVLDVLIAECIVDEVVVVAGEEYAAFYALAYPVLMDNARRKVVRKAQIEHTRFACDAEVESVVFCDFFKAVGKFLAFLCVFFGSVQRFCLAKGCDTRRKRYCRKPVAAGVRDVGRRVEKFLIAAEARYVVSVCDCLAEAGQVGFNAVMVIGTVDVDTEARAYVVDNKNYAVFVADFANLLPVSGAGSSLSAKLPC